MRLTSRALPAESTILTVIVAVTSMPIATAVLILANAAFAAVVVPFGFSFASRSGRRRPRLSWERA